MKILFYCSLKYYLKTDTCFDKITMLSNLVKPNDEKIKLTFFHWYELEWAGIG